MHRRRHDRLRLTRTIAMHHVRNLAEYGQLLLTALAAAFLAACGGELANSSPEVVMLDPQETVAIAAPDVALTFARHARDGRSRVVLVTGYNAGRIEGVDLSAVLARDVTDPIDVFLAEGYERLRAALQTAPPSARVQLATAELTTPVGLTSAHIAAGTNYPEHAADAGVKDGPFLFAKLVEPTAPYAPVQAGNALLDYEVEIAWLTLEPLAQGSSPQHMGVILCNDYTDRALLLRHLDPDNVASGDGFTTGKSLPGYLPVGNLLVIPRDYRAFVRDLELRLYVNDEPRQQAPASAMVWDFDELLAQTWKRRDVTWEHQGRRIALPGADGLIPARTLILAGTPHGTVFDGIPLRAKVFGALSWLAGGWSQPISAHVIERYIADAQGAGAYLQPGDRVEIRVGSAGVIRNDIR